MREVRDQAYPLVLMKLYHYTCMCNRHLGSILSDGVLNTTESNIGSESAGMPPTGRHVGPDVVWLTRSEHPSAKHGLEGSRCNKAAARIVVNIPESDVHPWSEWSKNQGINRRWQRRFERDKYPQTWYVVERAIIRQEWSSVETKSGDGWASIAF